MLYGKVEDTGAVSGSAAWRDAGIKSFVCIGIMFLFECRCCPVIDGAAFFIAKGTEYVFCILCRIKAGNMPADTTASAKPAKAEECGIRKGDAAYWKRHPRSCVLKSLPEKV